MARTAPIVIRVDPEVRDALKRAAADDARSMASFVEFELRRTLVARGYLRPPTPTPSPAPARKRGR